MCQDEPDPAVNATNVAIDVRWDLSFILSLVGRQKLQNIKYRLTPPKRYTGICEPVHRKAIAISDMMRFRVH